MYILYAFIFRFALTFLRSIVEKTVLYRIKTQVMNPKVENLH